MLKLIKPSDDKEYVDLVVSVKGNEGEDEDVAVPAIRYFFSSWKLLKWSQAYMDTEIEIITSLSKEKLIWISIGQLYCDRPLDSGWN